MSIREITPNFHIFARNISHRFPSFLIAFAQICPLLLPEFPIIAFARISGKSYKWENSGKTNEKIWAKAMRKLGKRRHIFRAKIIAFARISIAFSRISHCFFPNFPLLLPEFPMAFARISHCFCPNFSFSKLLGGTVPPLAPPPPPPPPTPMRTVMMIIPLPHYGNNLPQQISVEKKMCRSPHPPPPGPP